MLREMTKDFARAMWTGLQGLALLLVMYVAGSLMLFGVVWLMVAAARGLM